MTETPFSKIDRGTLLIASPEIESPIFKRKIVLVCDHSNAGSLGLMINHPVDIELPPDILGGEVVLNPHIHVRQGGPHQTNQLMLLHNEPEAGPDLLPVSEELFLGGDTQFLQDAATNSRGPKILLCLGYTAWGIGQLEQEFLNGDWFIHPCQTDYLYEIPPEKMWQAILRDMGGKYKTYSMLPEDLSLN